MALAIVYEDDDLIVIDKPAGPRRPSRPPATSRGTLVNALIAHCGESLSGHRRREAAGHRAPARQGHVRPAGGGQERPAPIRALAAQFADHGRTGPLERAYLALVWGVPERRRGTRRGGARPQHAQPREDRRRRRASAAASPSPITRSRRACPRHEPDGEPRALRAGDRAHAPDPRAHGPSRPSAAGRRDLRLRLQDQGEPPVRARSRRPWRPSAGRRCTPRCSASSIPRSGESLRFESPLPADMAALCSQRCAAQPIERQSAATSGRRLAPSRARALTLTS